MAQEQNAPDMGKKAEQRSSFEVTVAGETLRLTGVDSEEYIQSIAKYVDEKITELLRIKKTLPVNSQFMKILLPLNIADDLFKERDRSKTLGDELENTTVELEKYIVELGKLQQENFLLQKTIGELQLEIDKSRRELAQYIETFGQ